MNCRDGASEATSAANTNILPQYGISHNKHPPTHLHKSQPPSIPNPPRRVSNSAFIKILHDLHRLSACSEKQKYKELDSWSMSCRKRLVSTITNGVCRKQKVRMPSNAAFLRFKKINIQMRPFNRAIEMINICEASVPDTYLGT